MAKNLNRSDLDLGQMHRMTFDGDHDAVRMVLANPLEMDVSLSAESGDSVLALSSTKVVTTTDICDVSQVKTICLYTDKAAQVVISPSDVDDVWVAIMSPPASEHLAMSAITPICAMRLKVICDGPFHLVMQS